MTMTVKASVLLACVVAVVGVGATAQESFLEDARAAYEARADAAQAKAAVELFVQESSARPDCYAARWEGARAIYFYGTYTREDAKDDEKMTIFQQGIDMAKEAIALRPDGVEGHFWLGVLYGVYGEAKGIFKSLAMVPDIKQEMQACLDKDPSIEGWGPDRVLGRMFFKLPWFKGGDKDKSIEHLERSLKGAPTNALTRLYLAETYKSKGLKPKAAELCRSIIEMEPDPLWAAEHPFIKSQAEKLLRKVD